MKKALEDLVFLGYTDKEVTVLGKTWKLRVLNAEESLDTMKVMKDYDEVLARTYAYKIEVLGRAIKEVNGILIETPEEGLEFVKRLQSSIVNVLFEKYSDLIKEQTDLLMDKEEIKN